MKNSHVKSEALPTVDSLKKALKPFGKVCSDYDICCFGNETGKLESMARDGNILIYRCDSRLGGPEGCPRARINFELPEEEARKVAEELRAFVSKNLPSKEITREGLELFEKGRDKLTTKLRNYAQLLPQGKEVKVPGHCYYCLSKTKITLCDGKIWYGCSECASIIEDSAD